MYSAYITTIRQRIPLCLQKLLLKLQKCKCTDHWKIYVPQEINVPMLHYNLLISIASYKRTIYLLPVELSQRKISKRNYVYITTCVHYITYYIRDVGNMKKAFFQNLVL